VYRYRSVDRLLGESNELDEQYFFLSSPSDLNDPMEGHQNVVWKGDRILWENLLRHYLLALLWIVTGLLIMDDKSFTEPDVPGTLTEDDLPTEEFRALYGAICSEFFGSPGLSTLPDSLAGMPVAVRINGLRLLLSLLHLPALSTVVREVRRRGLASEGWSAFETLPTPPDLNVLFGALKEQSEAPDEHTFEMTALAFNQVRDQQTLGVIFRSDEDANSVMTKRKHYLLFGFPDAYARGIADTLIHPDWYVSCFSSNCTNASMWSVYGDQHKGVALMFRPKAHDDGRPFLDTTGVVGFSFTRADPETRARFGPIKSTLHKVSYDTAPPELNFFEFLGRLSQGKLMKAWHSDRAGTRSPLIAGIIEDADAWRKRLWALFHSMATSKLKDWSHEEEYRIVVADAFGSHRAHRRLRFDGSTFAGVVFGLRTPTTAKVEIARRLAAKNDPLLKDLKLYQMVYKASERRLIRL
jgi:hypothetical protein